VNDAYEAGVLQLLIRFPHQHSSHAQLNLDLPNRREEVAGSKLAKCERHLDLFLELDVRGDARGGVVVEQRHSCGAGATVTFS
jgi:hypothetical protein